MFPFISPFSSVKLFLYELSENWSVFSIIWYGISVNKNWKYKQENLSKKQRILRILEDHGMGMMLHKQ